MLSEERKREILASVGVFPRPKRERKSALVAMVDQRVAAAARANPESVRVSAASAEQPGVIEVGRARRTEVIEVVEVDGQGRPLVARRLDTATGEESILEFVEGYRPKAGVVSDYDPLARLKRLGGIDD